MSCNVELIKKAKVALRITTDVYDGQISDLLESAIVDLGIAGVEVPEQSSVIVETAQITYVAMNFGNPENYSRLKASYDEQKAQLSMSSGFTNWGNRNV